MIPRNANSLMGSARWVSKRAHGYPEVEVGKSRVNIKVILSFDSLHPDFVLAWPRLCKSKKSSPDSVMAGIFSMRPYSRDQIPNDKHVEERNHQLRQCEMTT